jgi:hypothetical protein
MDPEREAGPASTDGKSRRQCCPDEHEHACEGEGVVT